MTNIKKKTLILGANSFLGKQIIKKMPRNSYITGSSTKYACDFLYNIGDDISHKIPNNTIIKKVIYLSWERRNIIIKKKNINIIGISKIIKFCKKNKIPIYFASSFSAISKISNYGKLKFECEKLLMKDKINKIFRIAMVNDKKGGLIYKIKKIFNYLPFVILPDGGNFYINIVKLENVIKAFLKDYKNEQSIFHVYDQLNIRFRNIILNYKKKLVIPIPVFFLKIFLYFPYKFNIGNSSFNFDGLINLISDRKNIIN